MRWILLVVLGLVIGCANPVSENDSVEVLTQAGTVIGAYYDGPLVNIFVDGFGENSAILFLGIEQDGMWVNTGYIAISKGTGAYSSGSYIAIADPEEVLINREYKVQWIK